MPQGPTRFGATPSNVPFTFKPAVPTPKSPPLPLQAHVVHNGVPPYAPVSRAPQNLTDSGHAPQSATTPAVTGSQPGSLLSDPDEYLPPQHYSTTLVAGTPPPTPASRQIQFYNQTTNTPWQTLFGKGRDTTRVG